MERVEFNDGLCSGNRRPRLYLALPNGDVVKFEGVNVPNVCAVLTAQYEKNGKWSNTTYSVGLVDGVRPLHFLSPLHGVWGDKFASWEDLANALSLPIVSAQHIVRTEYTSTAKRLDAVEEFTASESSSESSTGEVFFVNFTERKKSTNKQIFTAPSGKKVLVNVEENTAIGGKILSVTSSKGMCCRYYTFQIGVIGDGYIPSQSSEPEPKSEPEERFGRNWFSV